MRHLPNRGDVVSYPRTKPLFTFNRDYSDLAQVAEWLPEFSAIRDEITSAGDYPYNDSFKGRIPGIGNTEHWDPDFGRGSQRGCGTHEDAAIYLLQKLYRATENAARLATAIEDGCAPIDSIDRVAKFSRVIIYDDQGWLELSDARLVPDTAGNIRAVLPKGRRRHGIAVNGRQVMVKR